MLLSRAAEIALLTLAGLGCTATPAPPTPSGAPVVAEEAAAPAPPPPAPEPATPPAPRPYPTILGAAGDPRFHAFWPVRPQRIERVEWRYAGGEHMGMAMPDPSGERVFVQAGAGSVRCLDTRTGKALWGGPGSPHFNSSSSVLGPGERSYGSAFNALRCVDREGKPVWEAALGASWVHAPPAVSPDGKRVYFGGDGCGLAVLDAATGEVLHRRGGSGSHNGYGFDDEGRLLLRTDGGIACLEESGVEAWAWVGGAVDFLFLDGTLYAAQKDRIVAWRPAGRRTAWDLEAGGKVTGLALAADRGEILAALESGELLRVGLDGRGWTRTRVSKKALAPPAAAPDGEAIVADADGVVSVLDVDGRLLGQVATGEGPHWSWGGRPVVGPDGSVYYSQRDALLRLTGPHPPDEGR